MSTATLIPIQLDPSFEELSEQDPSASGIYDLSAIDAQDSSVTKSMQKDIKFVSFLGNNRFRAIYSAVHYSKSNDLHTPVTVRLFPTPSGKPNVLYEKYWTVVSQLQEKAFSRMVGKHKMGSSTAVVIERVASEKVSTYIRRDITLDAFVALFSDIAKVLSVLHAAGFTHLDINSHNVLVGIKDRRILLADVGVWVKDKKQPIAYLISSGRFFAPEVEIGHHSPKKAFDFFSFGVMLLDCLFVASAHWHNFCMAHGRRLRAALEYRGLEEDPIGCLLLLATKCIDVDPARRPKSFDAIRTELSKVCPNNLPIPALVGKFIRQNGGMLPRIRRRPARGALPASPLTPGDVRRVHPVRESENVVASSVIQFLSRTSVTAIGICVRLGANVKIGLASSGLFLGYGFLVGSDLAHTYAALFFCATLLHEASRILSVKFSQPRDKNVTTA